MSSFWNLGQVILSSRCLHSAWVQAPRIVRSIKSLFSSPPSRGVFPSGSPGFVGYVGRDDCSPDLGLSLCFPTFCGHVFHRSRRFGDPRLILFLLHCKTCIVCLGSVSRHRGLKHVLRRKSEGGCKAPCLCFPPLLKIAELCVECSRVSPDSCFLCLRFSNCVWWDGVC